MIRLIVTYLATVIGFAAVDYVWLSQIGPKVYHPILDEVLRPANDPVNLPAAIVFYLAYIAGILGAMCYATYDLTNQATLKVWATQISIADILWGTFVTAAGATIGGFVLRRFKA